MSTITPSSATGQNLLANRARIPVIIPGTLSERRDSEGKINGWKLQRWYQGHNQTRYIPAEQVEKVREGTSNCNFGGEGGGQRVDRRRESG
jgi:hypothetical protein